MKHFFGSAAAAALVLSAQPLFANDHEMDDAMPEAEMVDGSDEADADCFLTLTALMDEVEEEDQEAFFSMSMFYFGKLHAQGGDIPGLLNIRMGALKDGDANMGEIAEDCANGYSGAMDVLEELEGQEES